MSLRCEPEHVSIGPHPPFCFPPREHLQVNPEVDLWNRSRNGKPADLIARPLSVFRFGAFLPFCFGSLFLILNPIRRSWLIILKDYQKIRPADFTDWCFAFSVCQKLRGRITGQNRRKRQRTYSICRRKIIGGLPKQDARMMKRSAVAGHLPSRPGRCRITRIRSNAKLSQRSICGPRRRTC